MDADTKHELLEILGQTVLFTCERINRSDVPADIYAYDLRHDDECQGIICEIKPYVVVNHWGTILCKEPIEMSDGGCRFVTEDDYCYLGDFPTLEEYQCGKHETEESEVMEMEVSIEHIDTESLRSMKDKEGLILQGCGGDPKEWINGINDMLTAEGIMLNGSRFDRCMVFTRGEVTNIMFPFDGVDLNIPGLSMWRLLTHDQFMGTWLSDYVPNYLGGFVKENQESKPYRRLIGEDGNILRAYRHYHSPPILGASFSHFCVIFPCHTASMPAEKCLELRKICP